MDLLKINKVIEEYSLNNNLKLYDISYQKNNSILNILFDNNLNLDDLEKISNDLSLLLDQYEDEFDDNYFLDISTVGIERPIRCEEDLFEAIGSYIYIKTKEKEYYGILKDYKNNILNMAVKEKNKKKNISLEYENIKKARYAVEF